MAARRRAAGVVVPALTAVALACACSGAPSTPADVTGGVVVDRLGVAGEPVSLSFSLSTAWTREHQPNAFTAEVCVEPEFGDRACAPLAPTMDSVLLAFGALTYTPLRPGTSTITASVTADGQVIELGPVPGPLAYASVRRPQVQCLPRACRQLRPLANGDFECDGSRLAPDGGVVFTGDGARVWSDGLGRERRWSVRGRQVSVEDERGHVTHVFPWPGASDAGTDDWAVSESLGVFGAPPVFVELGPDGGSALSALPIPPNVGSLASDTRHPLFVRGPAGSECAAWSSSPVTAPLDPPFWGGPSLVCQRDGGSWASCEDLHGLVVGLTRDSLWVQGSGPEPVELQRWSLATCPPTLAQTLQLEVGVFPSSGSLEADQLDRLPTLWTQRSRTPRVGFLFQTDAGAEFGVDLAAAPQVTRTLPELAWGPGDAPGTTCFAPNDSAWLEP